MSDEGKAIRRVAQAVHGMLNGIAGHPCDFVLVTFPEGRCDWILSHTEKEPAALVALYRTWLARFVEDGPKTRAAMTDEAALSFAMRDLAKVVETLLDIQCGQDRFALVVFPNDIGMYCANITRESAKLAMVELMAHMERRHEH